MADKKITLLKAPYDSDGNLAHYAGDGYMIRWRNNEPFHATLSIDGARSGRSAKYVILSSPQGGPDTPMFPMFVTELIETMRLCPLIRHGIIDGRWIVCKRGRNYGLRYWPET